MFYHLQLPNPKSHDGSACHSYLGIWVFAVWAGQGGRIGRNLEFSLSGLPWAVARFVCETAAATASHSWLMNLECLCGLLLLLFWAPRDIMACFNLASRPSDRWTNANTVFPLPSCSLMLQLKWKVIKDLPGITLSLWVFLHWISALNSTSFG